MALRCIIPLAFPARAVILSLFSVVQGWAPTIAFENGFPTSPFGIGGDYHTNRYATDNARWVPRRNAANDPAGFKLVCL